MSGPGAVRSIRVERENGVGSAGIGDVPHFNIRVARNRRAGTVAPLLRPDLETDLAHEAVAPLQPAPQRLDKIAIALGPLCLGGSLRALGQRRGDRQPKSARIAPLSRWRLPSRVRPARAGGYADRAAARTRLPAHRYCPARASTRPPPRSPKISTPDAWPRARLFPRAGRARDKC